MFLAYRVWTQNHAPKVLSLIEFHAKPACALVANSLCSICSAKNITPYMVASKYGLPVWPASFVISWPCLITCTKDIHLLIYAIEGLVLRFRDKTRHDLFPASLIKGNIQLIAFYRPHITHPEFLMEHAVSYLKSAT